MVQRLTVDLSVPGHRHRVTVAFDLHGTFGALQQP